MTDCEMRNHIEAYMRERFGDSSELSKAKSNICLMSDAVYYELSEERGEYFAWEDQEECHEM